MPHSGWKVGQRYQYFREAEELLMCLASILTRTTRGLCLHHFFRRTVLPGCWSLACNTGKDLLIYLLPRSTVVRVCVCISIYISKNAHLQIQNSDCSLREIRTSAQSLCHLATLFGIAVPTRTVMPSRLLAADGGPLDNLGRTPYPCRMTLYSPPFKPFQYEWVSLV